MIGKRVKKGMYVLCISAIIILTISMVSAGSLNDFLKKLSVNGKASSANVGLNISVTSGRAPNIFDIYNSTITDFSGGINEGPSASYVTIKFGVSDADGIANLNNATAKVNFSKAGEITRENTTCLFVPGQSTVTTANYTCNITMWWFDGPGTWGISAYIADLNSNMAYNNTIKNFSIGPTDGLQVNRTSLTWPSVNPGSTNTEANEFMGINNTGNRYRSIVINSSDLLGETTPSKALGASNFSVKDAAGCEGTAMVNRTDTNVTTAKLYHGNYTLNNGTAQEIIYYCLETANSDLTAQAYSTQALGAWIVKVA